LQEVGLPELVSLEFRDVGRIYTAGACPLLLGLDEALGDGAVDLVVCEPPEDARSVFRRLDLEPRADLADGLVDLLGVHAPVVDDFHVTGELFRDELARPDEEQELDRLHVVVKLVRDVQDAPLNVLVTEPPLGVRDDVEVLLLLGIVLVDPDEGVMDAKAIAYLGVRSRLPVLGQLIDWD
jgi:hypothetical protein